MYPEADSQWSTVDTRITPFQVNAVPSSFPRSIAARLRQEADPVVDNRRKTGDPSSSTCNDELAPIVVQTFDVRSLPLWCSNKTSSSPSSDLRSTALVIERALVVEFGWRGESVYRLCCRVKDEKEESVTSYGLIQRVVPMSKF